MSNLILFFDTETTGLPNKKPALDPNQARLIQLGAILASPEGEILHTINTLVQIGDATINPYALAAHGITAKQANEEGLHPKEVFEQFHRLSDSAECLVCHNHNFDFNIIKLTAQQITGYYEDPTDPDIMLSEIEDLPFYCTMVQATEFCALPKKRGSGFKYPKLMELYSILFEKEFSGAHDAMADVTATMECFFELKRRGVM
jgi:DNA polymerase III epsilon subunit-like protein